MYKNGHGDLIASEVSKGQICNIIKPKFKQCYRVVLGQTCKGDNGDFFIRPVVKGSEVNKGQICNIDISSAECNNVASASSLIFR